MIKDFIDVECPKCGKISRTFTVNTRPTRDIFSATPDDIRKCECKELDEKVNQEFKKMIENYKEE